MKGLLSLILVLLPLVSFAGGKQTGQVTKITIRQSDGLHYFNMSGISSDRATCAEGHSYWMIEDENSPVGKHQLSLLMMAMASGKTITVYGTGTCSRWGDGESVDAISISQ